MPALAKLSLKFHISLCSAEEFLPWLRMLKNRKLKNVNVVITGAVTGAENREQIGASIREIFVEETRKDDFAIEITVDSDCDQEGEVTDSNDP
jgi:hypothetical protein